jgi:hypothetical protein
MSEIFEVSAPSGRDGALVLGHTNGDIAEDTKLKMRLMRELTRIVGSDPVKYPLTFTLTGDTNHPGEWLIEIKGPHSTIIDALTKATAAARFDEKNANVPEPPKTYAERTERRVSQRDAITRVINAVDRYQHAYASDDPAWADEESYAEELICTAARELVETTDAVHPNDQPIGWKK